MRPKQQKKGPATMEPTETQIDTPLPPLPDTPDIPDEGYELAEGEEITIRMATEEDKAKLEADLEASGSAEGVTVVVDPSVASLKLDDPAEVAISEEEYGRLKAIQQKVEALKSHVEVTGIAAYVHSLTGHRILKETLELV
jgi:hypothetical protein